VVYVHLNQVNNYQLLLVVVEDDYVKELYLKHHLFEQLDVNQILVFVVPIVVEKISLYMMDVVKEHNEYGVEQLQNHHYDDENYFQLTYYPESRWKQTNKFI
jgi:hypothetical protein